jgi:hypothetical protein
VVYADFTVSPGALKTQRHEDIIESKGSRIFLERKYGTLCPKGIGRKHSKLVGSANFIQRQWVHLPLNGENYSGA